MNGPILAPERAPAARPSAVYLDDLRPVSGGVGYGALGSHGDLGYEGKAVMATGTRFKHALSTHPPARISYQLDGLYRRFRSRVCLNDDVTFGASAADFVVRADGREVALVSDVGAGEEPREVDADVSGAQLLELVVSTRRWEYCHAVWLEPRLESDTSSATPEPRTLVDCLRRAKISVPVLRPQAERCIATVVSPGYEALLDDMLGSVVANGCSGDALIVVFAIAPTPAVEAVTAKYGVTVVRCEPLIRPNLTCKSILYSVAQVIDADQFLCLDADTLVLGDLRPVFGALAALPESSILACREANHADSRTIDQLLYAYDASLQDLERILGSVDGEAAYPLVVNDGCFAGSRTALLALDADIRGMPGAIGWIDEGRRIGWRNQLVFNLALARLGAGVELDSTFNVQLHIQDVELEMGDGFVRADWHGKPVHVLHLSGRGKRKYPGLRGAFARIADPLPIGGPGDTYADFLAALRAYCGRCGLQGLTWSFYGLPDGSGARVNDASTFPALGVLHYLVRSNGCTKVIETGTARGVSAACLASAVAHRAGGRVISLDVERLPEREVLWTALPQPIRSCIEPRQVDALEGLRGFLETEERFDAALLDSLHTTDHVWAEFDLVRRLVRPGGLIMIHDVALPARYGGGVEAALQRIERSGYAVTRLFLAEGAAAEEAGLGLAVIENRQRSGG